MELNALPVRQLDDAVGGDGISSSRAAVTPDDTPHHGGADGDDVFAGRQLPANLHAQRRRQTGEAGVGGMTVDVIGDEAVCRHINERTANDGLGRKFDGEPDTRGLARGRTGIDPGRFCQRGLLHVVSRQIGGDPAALPFVGGIEQPQLERGSFAPRGGQAVLVPDANLPENL